MDIHNCLKEMAEINIKDFCAKLIPNVDKERILGVRIPKLRSFSKDFIKMKECEAFIKTLPHYYLEENALHAILLSNEKDYSVLIKRLDEFLPYVDNWQVCDILIPKTLKKDKTLTLKNIKRWIDDKRTYISRFGIKMLMTFYLDKDFKAEYLTYPKNVVTDEYYLKMMIAWFYATALSKQWVEAVKIIESKSLPKWVHNKTIQKAIESYRITEKQKEYLRSLKG